MILWFAENTRGKLVFAINRKQPKRRRVMLCDESNLQIVFFRIPFYLADKFISIDSFS